MAAKTMAKLIVCAGAHRSGGTWQFNAVRSILDASGVASYTAYVGHGYAPARPEPVHVLKVHLLQDLKWEADFFLTSYRDLRDALASLVRMGWNTGTREHAERYLSWYIRTLEQREARAQRSMRYEAMMADPRAEMAATAAAIGHPLNDAQLTTAFDALKAIKPPAAEGGVRVDPVTLLHVGHIASTPATLDPAVRKFVGKRFGDWLRARDYPMEEDKEPFCPEAPANQCMPEEGATQ